MEQQLLEILVCPDTKLPLRLANGSEISDLNSRIRSGQIRTRGGVTVTAEVDSALIRSDQKIAYPIRSDIPILLIEEGMLLSD